MTSAHGGSLVDEIIASPVGVAMLAAAEARVRDDVARFDFHGASEPGTVLRASAAMAATDAGAFLALVLDAATRVAGPWTSGAPEALALAYEAAADRRPIAETVAGRFGELLQAPLALGRQEWWHSNREFEPPFDRKFVDFGRVYGNGEFPWDGLWTVTDPPPETHDALVDTWELFPGPISRWRLPARDDARVWRIDCPQDWVDLVERYPREAPGPHSGWELPGPNQRVGETARLLATPAQHAARAVVRRHVLPDWGCVRHDFDGVHLSWTGFITTEGRVSNLADGSVTMLRYWGSERTLWLADVFREPEPLSAPALSGRVNGDEGISVRDDAPRQQRDLLVLRSLLGR